MTSYIFNIKAQVFVIALILILVLFLSYKRLFYSSYISNVIENVDIALNNVYVDSYKVSIKFLSGKVYINDIKGHLSNSSFETFRINKIYLGKMDLKEFKTKGYTSKFHTTIDKNCIKKSKWRGIQRFYYYKLRI